MENEIKKEARKLYYNYLVRNIRNIFVNKDTSLPHLDMRFNRNRDIMSEFSKLLQKSDFDNICRYGRQKYVSRIRNKPYIFGNILNNPIVVDYFESRHYLVKIYPDHLNFGTRNHWAKSETDIKILAILAKNFKKYKEAQK